MLPIVTDEYIQIPIPFAVPILGLNEPTTISIDKARLQLIVRIIVAICTGFLLWPKFRTGLGLSNRNMDAEQRDIQERIAKLEHEREQRSNNKVAAVATGNSTPSTPQQAKQNESSGSGKRRKA